MTWYWVIIFTVLDEAKQKIFNVVILSIRNDNIMLYYKVSIQKYEHEGKKFCDKFLLRHKIKFFIRSYWNKKLKKAKFTTY